MFKRNEGIVDRLVRVAVGVVFTPVGLLLLAGLQSNVPGIIFIVLGAIALITGITGFCPTYVLFGISTLEKEKQLIEKFTSMAARCSSRMGSAAGPSCWPGVSSTKNLNNPE